MQQLYLVAAIAGGVVPYIFFVDHFQGAGTSLASFVRALFANPAAGGATADLVIASVVFWIFIVQQRARGKGPVAAPFVLLNLVIGLSCALPAYLYARERSA